MQCIWSKHFWFKQGHVGISLACDFFLHVTHSFTDALRNKLV